MKFGSKVTAIVLLFAALVLINYLASSLPVRIDSTAEKIYTLSPGTRALLGKLEEPVTLDFYFSKSANGLPIMYKNYAARVQEMLRQYVRASHGNLQLNVIDPRPDTPEEEKATAAGLAPQMMPNGDRLLFGLVATLADREKTVAAFTPQREQFLEYDISQLIYSVQDTEKKKLGLVSSIPLRAPPPMPMMRQPQQRETQFVINEWENSFDLVPVEATAAELPANLDALAIVHPQNLSPALQFAIDQFLLAGKPVFIAVDPSSQYFKRQGGQMAMYGGPQPNVSSNLPELFKAYGIVYNPDNVVGDLENAAPVSTQSGTVRYPIWLSLEKNAFNSKALPTAQLNTLWLIEAGSLSVKADPAVTVTPLVESSAQTGELATMMTGFAQPEEISRQITPTGKKTLAVMLQGKLKTAFPNGAPKSEKPDETKGDAAIPPVAKKDAPASSIASLKESKTSSTLVVIADTDWLLDDYSVRRMNFLGSQAAEPLNDNLAFASNTLEFLAGSQDLISIRGKGSSLRPFTVVRAMEIEAQKKYQEKLTALERRLNEVQSKLTELQGKKTDSNRLLASPEITKAIEDFQKQESTMRGERRNIRRALREDVDSLENSMLVINLLTSPLLVGVFGFWFYRHRRK